MDDHSIYKKFDRNLILTEEEILSRWGQFDKPLVSINCITYNHEKFISDALDSFLFQQTDFPFEILVHDDASIDQTAEIIKSYEKRYPNIIKPIYQKENQFSKGIKSILLNFERAHGEYIAICEGDDYWTDPYKLQKQISAMRLYPKVNISFHPAIAKYEGNSDKDSVICDYGEEEKIFSIENVIAGGGGFMPTASIIIRRTVVTRLPTWFHEIPSGDVVIQTYGAMSSGAFFIPSVMSVYRKDVQGSWSYEHKCMVNQFKHNKKINNYYRLLEKDFPKYSFTIKKKLIRNNLTLSIQLLKQCYFKYFVITFFPIFQFFIEILFRRFK